MDIDSKAHSTTGLQDDNADFSQNDNTDSSKNENEDFSKDSHDSTNESCSQSPKASPAVQEKINELHHTGSKGLITWTKLSIVPCELAGKLTYHDMELTFDLHDLGMTMIEKDGTVVYAMETRGENSVVATVEGKPSYRPPVHPLQQVGC